MSVEKRMAKFLRDYSGEDFCDDCLAAQVGGNRHQARNATAGFECCLDFDRNYRVCSKCAEVKKVIRALSLFERLLSAWREADLKDRQRFLAQAQEEIKAIR